MNGNTWPMNIIFPFFLLSSLNMFNQFKEAFFLSFFLSSTSFFFFSCILRFIHKSSLFYPPYYIFLYFSYLNSYLSLSFIISCVLSQSSLYDLCLILLSVIFFHSLKGKKTMKATLREQIHISWATWSDFTVGWKKNPQLHLSTCHVSSPANFYEFVFVSEIFFFPFDVIMQ